MNKQPELHTTNLLMQPLSISFENAALQILRFSKIHENTHAWAIPLHTHPTIELHYILSGAGQIQIDDTLFHVETNDIYVTLPFVPHCQISSAADIMEEYCVECTLELPPAVKGETDPLASLRRFLSRQAFSSARAPDELLPLLREVKAKYPGKTIWCFTGFRLDDELLADGSYPRCEATDEMLACIDVLVDGRFMKELKDISLQFRGSRNQRVIDMNRTRETGTICIWDKLRR